ncbi:MAG: PQQ-binding-like beta-propeller repeat protein [Phycisphaerae bacterium]
MDDQRTRWMALVGVGFVACLWALPAAQADWPMMIEDGDRTPPVEGVELVNDLNAMRKVWHFRRHMSVGKGLYPGNIRRTIELGYEPFEGGASTPIVAEGKVFVNYYKPDGEVPAEVEGWRTMGSEEKLRMLPEWFWSVTADDILVAVDAETGELAWEAVEPHEGLNRLSHKRGHWSTSPAYGDGRVFSMGSAGLLRAYDASDGDRLWEAPAWEDLSRLREEHIESGKLCWQAADRSSLVVAENVVIASRERMRAFDTDTGELRWKIDRHVQGDFATPTIWRHDGREYILANSGDGTVRLIDPANGNILWTHEGLGPFMGTLSPHGDLVVLNASPADPQADDDYGLYGGFRISLNGLERLWTLPDEQSYYHSWTKDRGPRLRVPIRDGLAYICLPRAAPREGEDRHLMLVVDAETGEIKSRIEGTRAGGFPMLIEDRIMLHKDHAHSNPVTSAWWKAGQEPTQLNGETSWPHDSITAYCTQIETPYVNGRIYMRALDGLVCYDLRKPDESRSQTLKLSIPEKVTGKREDLDASIYVIDEECSHGGFEAAPVYRAIEASELRLRQDNLEGYVLVDLQHTGHPERYDIDARLSSDGSISGMISTSEEAFEEPLDVSGEIHLGERQPEWMPECTHVLWLQGASVRKDGQRQPMFVFLTIEDGDVVAATGMATRTTKAWLLVNADGLEVKSGRITGELVVRHRPDEWTTPLTGNGSTAGGVYEIDIAADGAEGVVGSYTGTYGAAWRLTADINGRVER